MTEVNGPRHITEVMKSAAERLDDGSLLPGSTQETPTAEEAVDRDPWAGFSLRALRAHSTDEVAAAIERAIKDLSGFVVKVEIQSVNFQPRWNRNSIFEKAEMVLRIQNPEISAAWGVEPSTEGPTAGGN